MTSDAQAVKWRATLILGGAAVVTGIAALLIATFCRTQDSASRRQSAGMKPNQSPNYVQGQVVDAGGPVADAVVVFQTHSRKAITDGNGFFDLGEAPAAEALITAAKEGYFIARGKTSGNWLQLQLQPLPTRDEPDYAWIDPRPEALGQHNCAQCHEAVYNDWLGSAHARSATNGRLHQIINGTDLHGRSGQGWNLSADHPHGAKVCLSCHQPTATLSRHDEPAAGQGLGMLGIHCDYCHKIQNVDDTHIGLSHGRFGVDLLRSSDPLVIFGPRPDSGGEGNAFSPLHGQSRVCASCHEGILFGVHVYSTYSEWLTSPARRAGQQCQSCHMKATGTIDNLAPGKGGFARNPTQIASHGFLPGGLEQMLRSCLRVNVTTSAQSDETRVEVSIVAENVGHRVPTGFIDRHLILLLRAKDKDGAPVAAISGPVLGSAAGRDKADEAGVIFGKILLDSKGNVLPFWRAQLEPVDNRLLPGEPRRLRFVFPAQAQTIRITLTYHRFWEAVVNSKSWPDESLEIFDQTYEPR